MAVKTGNTYISETATDNVEIPTTDSTFSTTNSSLKVSASHESDSDNDGQTGN